MKLTLAFSPCPNDTFIFDALVNHKIDTEGIEFDVLLEDVQTLNEWARNGKADVCKISYGNLLDVLDNYVLLRSGGALGEGAGPLLISRLPLTDKELNDPVVAVPGRNTTAHVLLKQAYPELNQKVFLRYDEIESFVLEQSASQRIGVIIHENRFTYADRGLHKIADLGEVWERRTASPVPLGGIVARRTLTKELLLKIERLIRQSLEYARVHSYPLPPFVTDHAREMSTGVMQQHIDLYVNHYSLDLGPAGTAAVKKFMELLREDQETHSSSLSLFIE